MECQSLFNLIQPINQLLLLLIFMMTNTENKKIQVPVGMKEDMRDGIKGPAYISE